MAKNAIHMPIHMQIANVPKMTENVKRKKTIG